MRYTHSFIVNAPLDQVASFHVRTANMGAITPPPIRVQVHRAPERMAEGDEMEFTLWMGPLPVRWVARFEDLRPNGFLDRQVSGPFRSWLHTHTFISLDPKTTEVRDEITTRLKSHPFWWLFGLGMWLGMPVLFFYRARQTRRLLETASGSAPGSRS